MSSGNLFWAGSSGILLMDRIWWGIKRGNAADFRRETQMIVLVDGIKYRLLSPESEAWLEKQIAENYQHIFGDNSIYFPKKKIKSKAGNRYNTRCIPHHPGKEAHVVHT